MIGSVDLYAEEPVLRGNDSRFVRAAGISFGRPTIGPVADNELPAADQRRPDLLNWRFTRLNLPFDLEDLAAGRHYTEATVRMTFNGPGVRTLAMSLLPPAGGSEDSETGIWGVGRGELTWKLAARDPRAGIRPSGRHVQAVLESPLDTDLLTGSLDGTVRFIRRMLGMVNESVAEPKQPLRFVLNVIDGAFAFVAD
jgi:hypothetical protein